MVRWTTWHSHAQVHLRICSFVVLFSPQISLNYLFHNFLSCDNSTVIVWYIKKVWQLVCRIDTFDGDCWVSLPGVLCCPNWQCGWTELRNIQNKKWFKMFDSYNIILCSVDGMNSTLILWYCFLKTWSTQMPSRPASVSSQWVPLFGESPPTHLWNHEIS